MPPRYRWQQDVQVGQHRESGDPLLADLWRPGEGGRSSGLGIIYLHGSGWHYADKDFGTRRFFRHLVGQGHLVADLAYALAPKADLFAMVADVKCTLAWMKLHADELGIERERIVLIGVLQAAIWPFLPPTRLIIPRLTRPTSRLTPQSIPQYARSFPTTDHQTCGHNSLVSINYQD